MFCGLILDCCFDRRLLLVGCWGILNYIFVFRFRVLLFVGLVVLLASTLVEGCVVYLVKLDVCTSIMIVCFAGLGLGCWFGICFVLVL